MGSGAKAQKEFDRLARVRENQRKSRARRQEYVQELEQRLAAIQQEARQMDIDDRIAVQRMEAQNWHLKNLIMSLGLSAASVKRSLQLAEQKTVADRKVAIPVMERPAKTNSAPCQSPCSTSQVAYSVSSVEKDSVEQPPVNDNVQSTRTIPTQEPTEQQQQCTISPSCKSTTEQLASETRPHDQNTFNTTLCAAADQLLDRHNARGIDIDELRSRICASVKETDRGCCRVQNHILFHILDEISDEKLP